ncbi:Fc.00g024540.m01.CDS01 [Cosmosporella sp. VM-42]
MRKHCLVIRSEVSEETTVTELFNDYVEHIEKGLVTTRGWTCQERILAKASFTTAEEPFSSSATLSEPQNMPRTASIIQQRTISEQTEKRMEFLQTAALMGMRGEFQLLLAGKAKARGEKAELHDAWFEIAEKYLARSLAEGSDRVVVTVGIGNFVQKAAGRKFVAGTWQDILDLLWNTANSPPLGRIKDRFAPTWFWTSIQRVAEMKLRSVITIRPSPWNLMPD